MANIQDLWCGKTSPEHSRQTRAKTSRQYLKKSAKSKTIHYLYLNLKAESGQTQEKSWEMRSPLRGECLTLNIGEFANEENASTLSQILQENVPEKYYLSKKACQGILRRASARGKQLPTDVKDCVGATGFDGYNGQLTGDVSSTIGVNCGMSTGRNGIVLNDQGGNRMDITEDVTCTLRAEAHHPPCVLESAGFCTEHSAKSRGIGYEEEISPTIRAGTVPSAVMFENHSQDTRYTGPVEKAPTVLSTYGTGGNNQPFVIETPKALKIRSGCDGGGKGALVQDNKSATLSCKNDQTVFVPQAYGICSKDSNSMKSDKANENTLSESKTCGNCDFGKSHTIFQRKSYRFVLNH